MIQHIIPESTLTQNITYGVLSKGILNNRRDLKDLSDYTVIIVSDEIMDLSLARETADLILSRGCKNIAFCGTAAEELQAVFDEEDRAINGFNDITGYEDFAVMWRFEDPENLYDEITSCWNRVLVLAGNMSLLRQCRDIISVG